MTDNKDTTDEVVKGVPVDDGMDDNDGAHDREEVEEISESHPKLNLKNYLNVVAFATNIVVNYVIGVAGIAPYTVGGRSDLYQTIISPDSYAFSIWSLIFISQAIFCIAQLLRRYRSLPIVQEGISWYFIIANICQASWIFAWCWDQITIALVLILLVDVALNALVINQSFFLKKQKSSPINRYIQFWLFQFPFQIHCGWITAASALNVNIQFIAAGVSDPSIQLAVGILTLAVLHAIALGWLYLIPKQHKPNYTIPLVLAWANAAIAVECSNPQDSIVERFGDVIIKAVMYASGAVAVIIGCLCLSRLILDVVRNIRSKRLESTEEPSRAEESNETSSDDHEQV